MTPEIKQRIEQIRRGEVPEGFKHNSASVMPCDWNTCDFHEVATIQSGLVSPKVEPYCFMFHIGPDNIERDTGRIGNLKTACELGLVSGKFYFDAGSIVYSKIRPNLNKVCIPNFEGICSADCYSIKTRVGIDRDYLFNFMLSFQFYKRAVACSMRTGMPKINQDDLNMIPVVMPSQLEEQQKIAAILTTQDKVIELKEKLLAEKQRQKKYLMQQLLTGKKRLPGFSGEWEKKGFDEVFTFGATNIFSRECMCEDSVGVKNIHYGDILVRYGEVLKLSEQEIPSLLSDIGAKITTFVDDGDVVIADTAEDLTAGKVVEVQETHGKKVASGLHTMLCKPIKGYFAPGWLGYYMNSETYHKQLVPYIAGVKVMSISKGNIVKTHILIPPIEEQTAIAEILSTADREIDLLRQDIEQEKQKKKALMQLLLTGIVRVNE